MGFYKKRYRELLKYSQQLEKELYQFIKITNAIIPTTFINPLSPNSKTTSSIVIEPLLSRGARLLNWRFLILPTYNNNPTELFRFSLEY